MPQVSREGTLLSVVLLWFWVSVGCGKDRVVFEQLMRTSGDRSLQVSIEGEKYRKGILQIAAIEGGLRIRVPEVQRRALGMPLNPESDSVCFCQVEWATDSIAASVTRLCNSAGLIWVAYDFDKKRFTDSRPYSSTLLSAIRKEHPPIRSNSDSEIVRWLDGQDAIESYHRRTGPRFEVE